MHGRGSTLPRPKLTQDALLSKVESPDTVGRTYRRGACRPFSKWNAVGGRFLDRRGTTGYHAVRASVGCRQQAIAGLREESAEVEAETGAGLWVEGARSALQARLRQRASKGKPQYRQGPTMWGDLSHGPRRRGCAFHATAQSLRPNPILSAPNPSTSKGG